MFDTLEIPGRKAVEILHAHRAEFGRTGVYPFLIGNADELSRLSEAGECDDRTPSEIIDMSHRVSVAHWIEERRDEAAEYEFDRAATEGLWPGEIAAKGEILIHRDVLSQRIHPVVYLGLARIESPWHLPAVTKNGSWNACPDPEAHCAFFRHWEKDYGAEIVTLSGDVIECLVSRPPTSREAAMELAWQQYWYCSDVVEQGVETVANLAATVLNSNYWYFWWD
jgi:hypothetical protein